MNEFAAALDDLLTAADVPTTARAWAAGDTASGMALWGKLDAMGVFSLALDGTPMDVVAALEVLGRHAMPGPVLETLVASTLLPLDGQAARDFGALLCAAQLLGLGQGLLDMSVEYAKQRVQFGQPIGSFQAVKHKLADVYIALSFARPLLHQAADTLAPQDISAAKVKCADAAQLAARTALQVHGAIGYTAEYRLSLWLTKVGALIPAWGTRSYHRARILESL